MKKSFFLSSVLMLILFISSCKKDAIDNKPVAGLPVLETIKISAVRKTSAYSGGEITSDGGNEITARGICWSPKKDPTIMDSKTTDGSGLGTFTSFMDQLVNGETYYVRAYATNSAGTSYGMTQTFAALQLAQPYEGGFLVYVFQAGDPGYVEGKAHGLILSSNKGSVYLWGSYVAIGGTSAALGTGKANTERIVDIYGSSVYPAAYFPFLNIEGEYTDWYMPSKDELNKVFLVKDQIADAPKTGYLWTSTESSANTAWIQSFSTGVQSTFDKHGTNFITVCMRSF